LEADPPSLTIVMRLAGIPANLQAIGFLIIGAEMARIQLDLPLRCRCGHVRGVAREVSPSAGFRFVCYCKDCQGFAHFLDRADVLDGAGGTDIVQMPPSRLKLTAGIDAVRSLRFSNKVFRWYTGCCRTPVANTAFSARVPFVGLIHISFEAKSLSRNEMLDEIIGPPLCRIYERSAIGAVPANGAAAPSRGLFVLRAAKVLGWWWHGLGRPNPFSDDTTKAPLCVPRSVTPSERGTLF
jgi:hypothetical protein